VEKILGMNWPRIKPALVPFLHPDLFGSYVLAANFSVVVGLIFAFGYGCVFQIGGFLFLLFLPTLLGSWMLVLIGGAVHRWLWHRIARPQSVGENLPFTIVLAYSFLATAALLVVSILIGAEFRESKARKVCRRADSLIAMLQEERARTGTYPTNLRAYVKTNVPWRREVLFYYGETKGETNGVDWQPRHVAGSDITVMTSSNYLECMVPIERMSPISFSSFQVFVFTSDHPNWFKSRLHWSLNGAYVDPPKD
jgi:hypothetical protein